MSADPYPARSDAEVISDALHRAFQGEAAPLIGTAAYDALTGALSRAATGADLHHLGVQAVRMLLLYVIAGLTVQRSEAQARLRLARGGPHD